MKEPVKLFVYLQHILQKNICCNISIKLFLLTSVVTILAIILFRPIIDRVDFIYILSKCPGCT